MKKVIFLFATITLIAAPISASAIEESDLPPEHGTPQQMEESGAAKASHTIQAFANTKNVIMIGSVMGVTYHFCKEPQKEFCSDNEGILVVSGSDTGRIPRILRTLDKAIETKEKVVVKLSPEDKFLGVMEILDVELVRSTI